MRAARARDRARVTARVRRRLAPRKTGRLDFRRTIRAAVPHGGVPFERRYRGRRPGPPDPRGALRSLGLDGDATDFFLALLAPAAAYFRRVRLFGFVDRLVEIEFADGQVRPAGPIDLMARSDFGRVLRDLVAESRRSSAPTRCSSCSATRATIAGRRAPTCSPRRARACAGCVWLNPDALERWNTGDSVIATYARHADAVVACGTLAELEQAIAVVAKH